VAEQVTDQVIAIVREVLAGRGAPDALISVDSGMGNPPAWDSLAFVEIFTTVSSRLDLDVSDDDAIHFMTVREIVAFVVDNAA
jgi:acyl carrier protein